MDFLNFKENIFNNAEYCKDIVYSFSAPFTPNLFMLVAKYGSRTVRGVKNQNMHEVVFVPEKVLLESGFYAFVETLGGSCFKNNEYVTDIILPPSIEYFNEGQFEGCSNLKRITISKAINKIPANCFALCSKLEDVYYQGSDKEWEDVLISSGISKEKDFGNKALTNAKIHFNCDFEKHVDGLVKSISYAWSGRGEEFLTSPPRARCWMKFGNKKI